MTQTDFESRYSVTRKGLLSYLGSLGLSPDQVEDISQQTWLKVWAHRDSFRGSSDQEFSAWACRIARNCAFDRFRRRVWQESDLEAVFEMPGSETAADELLVQQETIESVRRVKYGEYLLWVVLFGMTLREVADKLNLNVKTVKTRTYRAAQLTRRMMTRRRASN